MKKIIFNFIIAISLLVAIDTFAHQKKQLSIKDTFLGNESDFQVCYPKDHRTYFYLIIAFGILSTSFGAWIIFLKTQNNKILTEKNKIIEDKNKDLVASIEYAKRIQFSILPSANYLKQINSKQFVLYMPKDTVSGDFYWIFEREEFVFYAVIDCTGHGVPGALLSLISHNGINKAIREENLINPTMILESMNNFVKNTLKQNEENGMSDGMEVALCCLNKKNNVLMYAGANLNLFLFSQGEFQEIKATRCTIGSVQSHVAEPPTTHIFQLKSNDTFYLTTDGYIDQFGGTSESKKKKFSLKQFKTVVTEVNKLSFEKQHDIIRARIMNWKLEEPQLDDICVMGVKV